MDFDEEKLENSDLKIVGDFRIFTSILLGKGQYGKVFLASLASEKISMNQKFFACKTLEKDKIKTSKKYEERVATEIGILKQLDHENIVKLIDVRSTINNFYLIFEYCSGKTLNDYRLMKKNKLKVLTEIEALSIIKKIVNGMVFCLSKQPPIIHRDLKPENILLQNGEIKISDFGFARLVHNSIDKNTYTTGIGILSF